MYRDSAGNPRPRGLYEIDEALMELDYCLQGPGKAALIRAPDPLVKGAFFRGWTAAATDEFGTEFKTGGYSNRSALLDDLRAAGFERFEGV